MKNLIRLSLLALLRPTLLTAMVAVLMLLLPDSIAFGQETPPSATIRYKSTLEVAQPPSQFDLIEVVLDFAPGAWTRPHSHGGQGLITVLEGEITLRQEGTEKVYKAGESWAEQPGAVHQAGNAGDEPAKLAALFLLPKDAQLTTVQETGNTEQAPPGPTQLYQSKLEVAQPPSQFDLVQIVVDFAPGAWTSTHSHGGQGLITVLEGEVTLRQEGNEKTYKAGETWAEQPGAVHQAGNPTPAQASLAAAFLLPKGAELTTVQQAAAPATLPQTGGDDSRSLTVWLLLLVGSGLIAGGWFVRQRVGLR